MEVQAPGAGLNAEKTCYYLLGILVYGALVLIMLGVVEIRHGLPDSVKQNKPNLFVCLVKDSKRCLITHWWVPSVKFVLQFSLDERVTEFRFKYLSIVPTDDP